MRTMRRRVYTKSSGLAGLVLAPPIFYMVYTYLLKSQKSESFYTGISQKPQKRLSAHNAGLVQSTKQKRPWNLVYKKSHSNYADARKHEKWLKKKNRKYKNKLAG